MAVVRFMPYIARRRNGNGPDDLSVVVGLFVEADDGKEVRSHAGLVARPDIESLGGPVSSVVEVLVVLAAFAERCPNQSHHNHGARQGREMQFVIRLHVRSLSSLGHCGLSATARRLRIHLSRLSPWSG